MILPIKNQVELNYNHFQKEFNQIKITNNEQKKTNKQNYHLT